MWKCVFLLFFMFGLSKRFHLNYMHFIEISSVHSHQFNRYKWFGSFRKFPQISGELNKLMFMYLLTCYFHSIHEYTQEQSMQITWFCRWISINFNENGSSVLKMFFFHICFDWSKTENGKKRQSLKECA